MESNHLGLIEMETLDFNDVVRFFQGVPLKDECPCCSQVSWEIPVVRGRDSRVVLNASGMSIGARDILQLKVSCNVCGYFRSHKVDVIKAWLENNPVADQSND